MEKVEKTLDKWNDGSQRRGLKCDRWSLFCFIGIQVPYLVLTGYAIQQLFTDFEEQTDFTGDLADTDITVTSARRDDLYAREEMTVPPLSE